MASQKRPPFDSDDPKARPLGPGQRRSTKRFAMGRATLTGLPGELATEDSISHQGAPRAMTWSGPEVGWVEPPADQETGAQPTPPAMGGALDVLASAAFLGEPEPASLGQDAPGAKKGGWYGGAAPMVVNERFSFEPLGGLSTNPAVVAPAAAAVPAAAAAATATAAASCRPAAPPPPRCMDPADAADAASAIASYCWPADEDSKVTAAGATSSCLPAVVAAAHIASAYDAATHASGGGCGFGFGMNGAGGTFVAEARPSIASGLGVPSVAASVADPSAAAAASGLHPPPAPASSTTGCLHRPCATCRAAKVLCNRELPCSRCRRLNLAHLCAPPPTVQRGRPSHHSRLLQLRNHHMQQQASPTAEAEPGAVAVASCTEAMEVSQAAAEGCAALGEGALPVASLPASSLPSSSLRGTPSPAAAGGTAAIAAVLPAQAMPPQPTPLQWHWHTASMPAAAPTGPPPLAPMAASSALVSSQAAALIMLAQPSAAGAPAGAPARAAVGADAAVGTEAMRRQAASQASSHRASQSPSPVPSCLSSHSEGLTSASTASAAVSLPPDAQLAQRQIEALRAQLLHLGVQPCV